MKKGIRLKKEKISFTLETFISPPKIYICSFWRAVTDWIGKVFFFFFFPCENIIASKWIISPYLCMVAVEYWSAPGSPGKENDAYKWDAKTWSPVNHLDSLETWIDRGGPATAVMVKVGSWLMKQEGMQPPSCYLGYCTRMAKGDAAWPPGNWDR